MMPSTPTLAATVRLLLLTLSSLLVGCGGDPFWLPRAHKITIQQGNIVSERQQQRLQNGMSREQVQAVLGAPLTATPFHADRWEYLYTRAPAGSLIEARRLSLIFENDQLARIETSDESISGEREAKRNWWEMLPEPE